MLAKEKRLNLHNNFTWVASGERITGGFLKLFIRFGENQYPKVGIATSKRDFKEAVWRNRARRLTSTGFERLYNLLPDKINIVAIPKANILKLNSEQIFLALSELLKKHKLLKDERNNN